MVKGYSIELKTVKTRLEYLRSDEKLHAFMLFNVGKSILHSMDSEGIIN